MPGRKMATDETLLQYAAGSMQFRPNQEDTEKVKRIVKQLRIKITSHNYALYTVPGKTSPYKAHSKITKPELNSFKRSGNNNCSKFKISKIYHAFNLEIVSPENHTFQRSSASRNMGK